MVSSQQQACKNSLQTLTFRLDQVLIKPHIEKSQDYKKKSIHFITNVWYLQKYPHILLLGNIVFICEKTHQNEKIKIKRKFLS